MGQDELHTHESTRPSDSPWLPYEVRGERRGLSPQPYCRRCGSVKNTGPDRARRLGFYANVLASVRRRQGDRRLNDSTVRLIMRRLSSYVGFEDAYAMTAYAQERLFTAVVREATGICESVVVQLM